jgi:hypothetical protein
LFIEGFTTGLYAERVSYSIGRSSTPCRLWPADKEIMRVKQKIRDTIGTRYSLKLEEVIHELNPVIRGWNNYQTRIRPWKKCFLSLNHFVDDRIRIFLKLKYSDQTRGTRRIAGGLPIIAYVKGYFCFTTITSIFSFNLFKRNRA